MSEAVCSLPFCNFSLLSDLPLGKPRWNFAAVTIESILSRAPCRIPLCCGCNVMFSFWIYTATRHAITPGYSLCYERPKRPKERTIISLHAVHREEVAVLREFAQLLLCHYCPLGVSKQWCRFSLSEASRPPPLPCSPVSSVRHSPVTYVTPPHVLACTADMLSVMTKWKGPPLEFSGVRGAEGSPKGNRKRHRGRKEE